VVKTPTFEIEDGFPAPVAGVDEVGRGPLAGPVVAAAVILDRACVPEGIRDSKMLLEPARKEIAEALWKAAKVGVGVASVEEIDKFNILRASLLAMERAVAGLPVRPKVVIVDGNTKPKLSCRCYAIVKGDALSLSIAAASIVAKVTRDRMMSELALEYPQYGWDSNKGYSVDAHFEALHRYGVTPHHRKSFAPVYGRLCQDDAPGLALQEN
jgi:ribonuclease HII